MDGSTTLWSPDMKRIAVSAGDDPSDDDRSNGARPHLWSIVIDVATGAPVAQTAHALDVTPFSWSAAGLILTSFELNGNGIAHHYFVWDASPAAPQPSQEAAGMVSPDGRYHLQVEGNTLRVTDANGSRAFDGTSAGDQHAIELVAEGLPTFIGAHTLLLRAEEMLALDLETLETRRLLNDRQARLVRTSTDGARAIVIPGGSHNPSIATR
jgi:hypothetical protein